MKVWRVNDILAGLIDDAVAFSDEYSRLYAEMVYRIGKGEPAIMIAYSETTDMNDVYGALTMAGDLYAYTVFVEVYDSTGNTIVTKTGYAWRRGEEAMVPGFIIKRVADLIAEYAKQK